MEDNGIKDIFEAKQAIVDIFENSTLSHEEIKSAINEVCDYYNLERIK